MVQDGMKEVKVGFLNYFSQYWMGGVTYFKNLFRAMSLVRDPSMKAFILKPAEACAAALSDVSTILECDEIPWDDAGNLPTAADYGVDVISHLQECKAKDGIAWIADFQHRHLPHMFSAEECAARDDTFRRLAAENRLVILSSEDARRDFCECFPEYADKARVLHFVSIPEPEALADFDKDAFCARLGIPSKFFYVPNQFWRHKNHLTVFKAVARLKRSGVDVCVVCSGQTVDVRDPAHFDRLMTYCKSEGISDNVKVLGVIDRRDVYFLQRQCVALVNPSRFEGWSSSVEESKSVGKKIILSNLPVHFEQNPKGGSFFPVDDDERLASIMGRLWKNSEGGIDRELEVYAAQRLPERVRQFGDRFKTIVLEALDRGVGVSREGGSVSNRPDVSVITVVYNAIANGRRESLIRCIDSVSAQEGVSLEHVVVDGASDDGTVDMLRGMQRRGAGFKLISEADEGIYDAMNKGVVAARGRYVAILNGDDFYHSPCGLRDSVTALDSASADFSYAPIRMIDERGAEVCHPHTAPSLSGIFTEMTFSHQSMLVRREAMLEMALFDTRYRSAADYDLVLRLILAGKRAVRVDQCFSTFRLGGFSQANMDVAQHEVGDVFSRLYGGLIDGITPEAGHRLYIEKRFPAGAAKTFGKMESSLAAHGAIDAEMVLSARPPGIDLEGKAGSLAAADGAGRCVLLSKAISIRGFKAVEIQKTFAGLQINLFGVRVLSMRKESLVYLLAKKICKKAGCKLIGG